MRPRHYIVETVLLAFLAGFFMMGGLLASMRDVMNTGRISFVSVLLCLVSFTLMALAIIRAHKAEIHIYELENVLQQWENNE